MAGIPWQRWRYKVELATIRELLLSAGDPEGDPDELLVWHDFMIEHDEAELAASALDRAYGLRPEDSQIAARRKTALDELAEEAFGIRFRYIPPGTFLMGSNTGDLDEQPVHPVMLGGYWMSETPITWTKYCELMGWEPPPDGYLKSDRVDIEDRSDEERAQGFSLGEANKIRRGYCDNQTFEEMREDDALPYDQRKYDRRPMVAVSWQNAMDLGERMTGLAADSGLQRAFNLPTEQQWEKAARGGLIQNEYAWGDDPPTHDLCDFDHADHWEVGVPTDFPPNGYGLYGMSGGVWEWVLDIYDALAYHDLGTDDGTIVHPLERVLRGGSWLDCADAMRVAFRMSRLSNEEGQTRLNQHHTPGIGFRLCMTTSEPVSS